MERLYNLTLSIGYYMVTLEKWIDQDLPLWAYNFGIWRLTAYIIAFYCVSFVINGFYSAIKDKALTVDGSLSISQILSTFLWGLSIPFAIVLVWLIASSWMWLVQDPEVQPGTRQPDHQAWETIALNIFYGVQFIVVCLTAMLICIAVFIAFIGLLCLIGRYLLKPIGNQIAKAYHAIRPKVPVKW